MTINHSSNAQFKYLRHRGRLVLPAGFRILTLVALITLLPSRRMHPQTVTEKDKPPFTRVFINLNGDPTLAHRLRRFIDFQVEDAGWGIVNAEVEADVTITGHVAKEKTEQTLQLGIVRIKSLTNETDTIDHCSNLTDGVGGELFENSAKSVSKLIKERYPKTMTVKLAADSDLSLSDTFAADLPAALDSEGLKLVRSETADLVLRMDLRREEIPIEATIVKYELTAVTRGNKRLISQTGHGELGAKLTGSLPNACPQRFMDLEWLYHTDPLLEASRGFVRDLRIRREGNSGFFPRKNTRTNQGRTVCHKRAA